MKAVVLLSGGLDSATCLGLAVHKRYEVYPISFAYGQRHSVELAAARQLAAHYSIPAERHRIVDLGRSITGSALTGDGEVPLGRSAAEMAQGIPATYVPARNTVFLAFAASYAESVGAESIFIGVNALDYSGYPDCRPEYIRAFQRVLRLGTQTGVEGRAIRIKAPLQRLGKADIVRLGLRLGVPHALTWSCYLGEPPACGRCDSCLLRRKGFAEAGVTDPIPYREEALPSQASP